MTPQENDKEFLKNNEDFDNEKNRTANHHVEDGNGDSTVLSTQGSGDELQEDLGGGTNLSLDQLKEGDGDPNNTGEEA